MIEVNGLQGREQPMPPRRPQGGRRYRRIKKGAPGAKALLLAGAASLGLAVFLLARYVGMTFFTIETQQELKQAYGTVSPAPVQGTAAADPVRAQLPVVSFGPAATPDMDAAAAAPTPEPAMGERFVPLYKRNKDVVGWLKMGAVQEIDFPVTHRDNEYYIDHDFYGRSSPAGTVFLDESNAILPRDENLILHGHNMKNGTMFGKLSRLLNLEILKQEPLVSFDTLYEQGVYAPYAVSVVSLDPGSDRYFQLVENNFDTEQQRSDYVQALTGYSAFALPVDVINSDELLTLATCHGDEDTERLIVAYRKLRSGESAEDIRSAIRNAAVRR